MTSVAMNRPKRSVPHSVKYRHTVYDDDLMGSSDDEEFDDHFSSSPDEQLMQQVLNEAWVQCEKTSCLKWRSLSKPTAQRLAVSSEPWFCHMNEDAQYNSCSISEEPYSSAGLRKCRLSYVYSVLPPGSLVLAQVSGYCSWPGMLVEDVEYKSHVELDEDGDPILYHVEFLGHKRSRCWVDEHMIELYGYERALQVTKDARSMKQNGRNQKAVYHGVKVTDAINEAERFLSKTLEQRLQESMFHREKRNKIVDKRILKKTFREREANRKRKQERKSRQENRVHSDYSVVSSQVNTEDLGRHDGIEMSKKKKKRNRDKLNKSGHFSIADGAEREGEGEGNFSMVGAEKNLELSGQGDLNKSSEGDKWESIFNAVIYNGGEKKKLKQDGMKSLDGRRVSDDVSMGEMVEGDEDLESNHAHHSVISQNQTHHSVISQNQTHHSVISQNHTHCSVINDEDSDCEDDLICREVGSRGVEDGSVVKPMQRNNVGSNGNNACVQGNDENIGNVSVVKSKQRKITGSATTVQENDENMGNVNGSVVKPKQRKSLDNTVEQGDEGIGNDNGPFVNSKQGKKTVDLLSNADMNENEIEDTISYSVEQNKENIPDRNASDNVVCSVSAEGQKENKAAKRKKNPTEDGEKEKKKPKDKKISGTSEQGAKKKKGKVGTDCGSMISISDSSNVKAAKKKEPTKKPMGLVNMKELGRTGVNEEGSVCMVEDTRSMVTEDSVLMVNEHSNDGTVCSQASRANQEQGKTSVKPSFAKKPNFAVPRKPNEAQNVNAEKKQNEICGAGKKVVPQFSKKVSTKVMDRNEVGNSGIGNSQMGNSQMGNCQMDNNEMGKIVGRNQVVGKENSVENVMNTQSIECVYDLTASKQTDKQKSSQDLNKHSEEKGKRGSGDSTDFIVSMSCERDDESLNLGEVEMFSDNDDDAGNDDIVKKLLNSAALSQNVDGDLIMNKDGNGSNQRSAKESHFEVAIPEKKKRKEDLGSVVSGSEEELENEDIGGQMFSLALSQKIDQTKSPIIKSSGNIVSEIPEGQPKITKDFDDLAQIDDNESGDDNVTDLGETVVSECGEAFDALAAETCTVFSAGMESEGGVAWYRRGGQPLPPNNLHRLLNTSVSMINLSKEEKFSRDVELYSRNKKGFEDGLQQFMAEHNSSIKRTPFWQNKMISLWDLFMAVWEKGGFDEACSNKAWKDIYRDLTGVQTVTSNVGASAKTYYSQYLLPYERYLTGMEYLSLFNREKKVKSKKQVLPSSEINSQSAGSQQNVAHSSQTWSQKGKGLENSQRVEIMVPSASVSQNMVTEDLDLGEDGGECLSQEMGSQRLSSSQRDASALFPDSSQKCVRFSQKDLDASQKYAASSVKHGAQRDDSQTRVSSQREASQRRTSEFLGSQRAGSQFFSSQNLIQSPHDALSQNVDEEQVLVSGSQPLFTSQISNNDFEPPSQKSGVFACAPGVGLARDPMLSSTHTQDSSCSLTGRAVLEPHGDRGFSLSQSGRAGLEPQGLSFSQAGLEPQDGRGYTLSRRDSISVSQASNQKGDDRKRIVPSFMSQLKSSANQRQHGLRCDADDEDLQSSPQLYGYTDNSKKHSVDSHCSQTAHPNDLDDQAQTVPQSSQLSFFEQLAQLEDVE